MVEKMIAWILILISMLLNTMIDGFSMDIQQEVLENEIYKYIAEMSLEEKIGQMLLVSFNGVTYNKQLEELIARDKIGGYILFQNNIQDYDQIRNLTQNILEEGKKHQVAAPFIAIDQEGGSVSRLDHIFYSFPGNMALAASNNTALSYQQGEITGFMLKHLGINLNFAPVVDVNSDYRNPVIGIRSFSNDPDLVGGMAKAFFGGQQQTGTISCIKHFPGHGNVKQDSHYEIPYNYYSIDEFRLTDIKPFEMLIQDGIEMIMTAHVKIPSLDKQNPATLSEKILQGELRERLGYKGVIITDDIGSMRAITSLYSTEEAAVKAIQAGADIVLIVSQPSKVKRTLEAIKRAVISNEITEQRINESVFRILRCKYLYGLFQENEEERDIDYHILYEMTVKHSEMVGNTAVAMIHNQYNAVPIRNGKTLFIARNRKSYWNPRTEEEETLENLIGQYFEDFDIVYIEDGISVGDIKKRIQRYDQVVLLSEKGYRYTNMRTIMQSLQNHEKCILMSLAEPYESYVMGDFHTHLSVFSGHRESIIGGLKVLKGEMEATGMNPVSFKK